MYGSSRFDVRWVVGLVTAAVLGSLGGDVLARKRRTPWRLRPLQNFRDAGKLSGLRTGRVFRSDDPRHRPFNSCQRILRAGIKSIIKLNGFQHRVRYGFRPYWRRGPCKLRELVVSLPYGRSKGARGMNIYQIGRRDLSAGRHKVVRHMERQLRLMFKELAKLKPEQLPVLIHCSLGRDRAGIVVALMQRLSGASPSAVVKDYVESQRTVGRTSARSLNKVLRRARPVRRFLRKVIGLNYWEVARVRRLMRALRPTPSSRPRPVNTSPRARGRAPATPSMNQEQK